MKQVSTRELLQDLAAQPIGSRDLQAEADRIAHLGTKPSVELKETIKRTAKLWLPQGKTMPVRGACNEPSATQTDLEDAIQSAGGERGGKPGDLQPRTGLLTVAKQRREFATLYRGELAMADAGYHSTFKLKRDAETFANFLAALFGNDRLEIMDTDTSARPTRDERDAMRAEMDRLRGKSGQ